MRVFMPTGFMKHFLMALIAMLCISQVSAQAGKMMEYSVIKKFSQGELQIFFKEQHIPRILLEAKQGIDIYEVIYMTTYSDGNPVKASAIAPPRRRC